MRINYRNRLLVRTGKTLSWVALTCAGVLPGGAAATDQGKAGQAWEEQITSVLELMQHDARRAREGAGVVATGALVKSATPAADDRLQLAALYGSAGALTAIVYVNGVRKEYRPGASLPYGGAGSRREYRLERIVDTCVVLRKPGARSTRSACYQPEATPLPVAPSSVVALDAPLPGFHARP